MAKIRMETALFAPATSQRPAIQKAFCKKGLVALDPRYKTVRNYCHRLHQRKSLALIKK